MIVFRLAAAATALLMIVSCGRPSATENKSSEGENNYMKMENCDITLGGLKFDKSQNLDAKSIKVFNDTLRITAGEKTDFFCDPKDKATNTSAPVIHTAIDNTKPFTFTVKVQPEFTQDGTYSAGALFAFVDDCHWQKLCFEQDEDGNHRIVTVRTVKTSDDNNHQQMKVPSVYLRMSSDTEVIGNYYSEDGEKWHLVRIYKNEYPEQFNLSLSAQSPKDKSHTCMFSEIELKPTAVADFRNGKL